jgi:hypothetical protein
MLQNLQGYVCADFYHILEILNIVQRSKKILLSKLQNHSKFLFTNDQAVCALLTVNLKRRILVTLLVITCLSDNLLKELSCIKKVQRNLS